jgi:hypothetical protein
MCGVTYASSSNHLSESGEQTISEQPRDEQNEIQVRDQRDAKGARHSNEKMDGSHDPDEHDRNGYIGATRAMSRSRLSENRPKEAASHQTRSHNKQAPIHRQANTPGNTTDFHQMGASKSIAVPDKVDHRSLPVVRSRDIAALSGQAFKNGHNRASSMVLLGGRANSTRSTAGISGTDLNRKP